MILNRIAKGFTSQNWLTVFIELLVVILGIFLGLQADNWNENRKDRIAEVDFLTQLHEDILVAEELSSRVKGRRLSMPSRLASAANTLFNRNGSSDLSGGECVAIAGSTYFNIGVAPLPSYIELVGAGRMTIIRNGDLRASLVKLQQAQEGLSTLILVQTIASLNSNLGLEYPDLIRLESMYDEEQKEIRSVYTCDLTGMRENHAFLNDFSVMADRYDAYVRDGLLPWSSQFENVHTIVDETLGIQH